MRPSLALKAIVTLRWHSSHFCLLLIGQYKCMSTPNLKEAGKSKPTLYGRQRVETIW